MNGKTKEIWDQLANGENVKSLENVESLLNANFSVQGVG